MRLNGNLVSVIEIGGAGARADDAVARAGRAGARPAQLPGRKVCDAHWNCYYPFKGGLSFFAGEQRESKLS
jgi:hypothetical protein